MKEALASLGLGGGGSPDLAQGEVPAKDEAALRDLVMNAVHREIAKQRAGTD